MLISNTRSLLTGGDGVLVRPMGIALVPVAADSAVGGVTRGSDVVVGAGSGAGSGAGAGAGAGTGVGIGSDAMLGRGASSPISLIHSIIWINSAAHVALISWCRSSPTPCVCWDIWCGPTTMYASRFKRSLTCLSGYVSRSTGPLVTHWSCWDRSDDDDTADDAAPNGNATPESRTSGRASSGHPELPGRQRGSSDGTATDVFPAHTRSSESIERAPDTNQLANYI